jgi:hypothetical protein
LLPCASPICRASWPAARPTRSARALYLGKTAYRIHGANQPSSIGTFVSSGFIPLTNEDVTDLYHRIGRHARGSAAEPAAGSLRSDFARAARGHTIPGGPARTAAVRDGMMNNPASPLAGSVVRPDNQREPLGQVIAGAFGP